MSRGLSIEVLELLEQPTIYMEFLFEANFSDETLRLWSGTGPLSWNGHTWEGNGWFLGFGNLRHTLSTEAAGLIVTLTGVPQELVALLLSDSYQRHVGRFYFAFFDEDGETVHVEPEFMGALDTVRHSEEPDSATVTLAYESALIRLKTAREVRLTDQTFRDADPNDRGGEYISTIPQQRVFWGRQDTTKKRN